MTAPRPITLAAVGSNFEREPLVRPFGFKGGYMSEIWQSVAMLQSESGQRGIGLCSQGVLWSDAQVFAGHSESGGNTLMYAMTEWAIQQLKGTNLHQPRRPARIDPPRRSCVWKKNHRPRRSARNLRAECAGGCRFRGVAALRGGKRHHAF
jgi:hypothetical protein